jgi:hypothetical protein
MGERDELHSYRYSSSWETSMSMEMAVKSMETAVEVLESMEMASGALPRPDSVPEQRLLSPEIGLSRQRCQKIVLMTHKYRGSQ